MLNLTLPGQHPNPESVVHEVQRKVNVSIARRQMQELYQSDEQFTCLTGNPIDDCWKCDSNWHTNRQRLADCGIGFGQYALGGKGGQIYVVTDSSDHDPVNPAPGTLRYAVIQVEPLWIVFSTNMLIKLNQELIFNSYKTLDGRGANVHIVGGGCITLQYITNVIIHNIHIHHCVQSGDTNVRSSPTHLRKLVQRMPRCRRGYIHVVNNDFTQWEMYAIGGSGNPTINSQGNRYTAPSDRNAKEVTKRVETSEEEWRGWNWRSEGDILVNGAFFIASGEGVEVKYEKAYSVEPKSAVLIDQLTIHAGVLGSRDNNLGKWSTGSNAGGSDFGSGDDLWDDMSAGRPRTSFTSALFSLIIALSSLLFLYQSLTSALL
ncbi:hypothetical protein L1049_007930 [Liquidambar formosana]|uniref:Pectate lyase n=1 Tax=Liquidambar formosana TaxID=63359 RepID=A0AAP0S923_LIQFO